MYSTIMVPVDLEHKNQLDHALQVAGDLAKHFDAVIHYVAVTTPQPSAVAANPDEFAQALDRFATEQAKQHGIQGHPHAMTSNDPAVDLVDTLTEAGQRLGADLIVMASHVPGFLDHVQKSHGSAVVAHADLSVFVVR